LRYGRRMSADVAASRDRGILVDSTEYPFVEVRFGRHSDADYDAYFEEMTQIAERPGPRVLLVDCTSSSVPSAAMRRRLVAWNVSHRVRIRESVGGVAFVIPSAVIRGVLTAMLWVQPIEAPYVIVKTRRDGLAACHHWLSL
jgi:hypothetical protein